MAVWGSRERHARLSTTRRNGRFSELSCCPQVFGVGWRASTGTRIREVTHLSSLIIVPLDGSPMGQEALPLAVGEAVDEPVVAVIGKSVSKCRVTCRARVIIRALTPGPGESPAQPSAGGRPGEPEVT